MMASITLEGNLLRVARLEQGGLTGWEHRLFFTSVLGMVFDNERSEYRSSGTSEVLDTLYEIVEYMVAEGVPFEVDKTVGELLQQFEEETTSYANAVIEGLAQLEHPAPLESPPGFVRKLKPYQEKCVSHILAVGHAANFSVPGSGKTTIALAAFAHWRNRQAVEKLLVIGPWSSFLPWEEEFTKCFGIAPRVARLTGSKQARASRYLEAEDTELFLCTYQTAANDHEDIAGLCRRFKILVVVDESHNIKRFEGGVWAEAILGLSRFASRRLVLSGTPVPNSYSDLWTQMTFLWPGKQVLGDRESYRYRSEDPDKFPKIRSSVRPFFSRIRKSDLGLPAPVLVRIDCELEPYQEGIYHALATRFVADIGNVPEERRLLRQWRKARMVRLIQAASNPALLAQYSEEFDVPPLSGEGASVIQLIEKYPKFEVPAKIEAAIRIVNELASAGKKVVLWTSFIHNIRMLDRILEDHRVFRVYGAVPRDETDDVEYNREQQLREFKETIGPAVLLANPAACAESISLQMACRDAVYLDRTFNCGQYMQSLDRIHRLGLSPQDVVTYHILIARSTIDEAVDERLEVKMHNMLQLLDGELPIGSLEGEPHEIGQSEDEEAVDFEESMAHLRRWVTAQ